jgi:hypothetical protein
MENKILDKIYVEKLSDVYSKIETVLVITPRFI